MGNEVNLVISHDGRHVVDGIKRRIGNDASQHQLRQEMRALILPEDTGDGSHQGDQGNNS